MGRIHLPKQRQGLCVAAGREQRLDVAVRRLAAEHAAPKQDGPARENRRQGALRGGPQERLAELAEVGSLQFEGARGGLVQAPLVNKGPIGLEFVHRQVSGLRAKAGEKPQSIYLGWQAPRQATLDTSCGRVAPWRDRATQPNYGPS